MLSLENKQLLKLNKGINLHSSNVLILGHYSALARLINLLRRAGKLDECSKYLDQVGGEFPVITSRRFAFTLIIHAFSCIPWLKHKRKEKHMRMRILSFCQRLHIPISSHKCARSINFNDPRQWRD